MEDHQMVSSCQVARFLAPSRVLAFWVAAALLVLAAGGSSAEAKDSAPARRAKPTIENIAPSFVEGMRGGTRFKVAVAASLVPTAAAIGAQATRGLTRVRVRATVRSGHVRLASSEASVTLPAHLEESQLSRNIPVYFSPLQSRRIGKALRRRKSNPRIEIRLTQTSPTASGRRTATAPVGDPPSQDQAGWIIASIVAVPGKPLNILWQCDPNTANSCTDLDYAGAPINALVYDSLKKHAPTA
jgi:hypothetical protein